MGRKFSEFSESDKSLKHELGLSLRSLICVLLALWSPAVRFEFFCCNDQYFSQ